MKSCNIFQVPSILYRENDFRNRFSSTSRYDRCTYNGSTLPGNDLNEPIPVVLAHGAIYLAHGPSVNLDIIAELFSRLVFG
jgi:hypothetical protein